MNKPRLKDSGFPVHGGELLSASRLSGRPVQDIIDFSVSINPLGLPSGIGSHIEQMLGDLKRYPDSESSELKQALADSLRINENHITITNGSTELIYFLPRLWKQNSSVVCIAPGFSEYERAFRLAGIEVHEWTLSSEAAFMIDMDAFLRTLDLLENLGGVVIGHPNNPTGALWGKDSINRLLGYCEKRNIRLVVDETFIEFAGWEHSLIRQVEQTEHLILVQSLTKFYSLPGLRVGYGITSPEIADRVRAFRPPWSVNSLAQKIGVTVLRDSEFKRKSLDYVKQERDYLYRELTAITSIEVFPSHANFLLFCLRGKDTHTALPLYQNLLRNGLLVRNCGNFKGLDDRFFRVAVKKRAENDLLVLKLNEYLI